MEWVFRFNLRVKMARANLPRPYHCDIPLVAAIQAKCRALNVQPSFPVWSLPPETAEKFGLYQADDLDTTAFEAAVLDDNADLLEDDDCCEAALEQAIAESSGPATPSDSRRTVQHFPASTASSPEHAAVAAHGKSVSALDNARTREGKMFFGVYPYRRVCNEYERALFFYLRDGLARECCEVQVIWNRLLFEHHDGDYLTSWPVFKKRLSDLAHYDFALCSDRTSREVANHDEDRRTSRGDQADC
jgi:hypothetical protein